MFLLDIAAATTIAALSAATAVASFLAYLHFGRRSEAHAARDEALALAQTRGEAIRDLLRRNDALEQQAQELREALGRAENEARDHAYQVLRFYAFALTDLLGDVQTDLEAVPPNVDRALARIRDLLDGERPAA